MGYNNQGQALVVMNNSDVYYISTDAAEKLADEIVAKRALFETVDVKSGKRLKLQVPNVSSIVEGDSKNG